MYAEVKGVLGPVLVPMVGLWASSTYLSLDLFWRKVEGTCEDAAVESAAAKLKRIGNAAMVLGIFGQIWTMATGLSGMDAMAGASSIAVWMHLIGISVWSTLAGLSVAMQTEIVLIGMLWLAPSREVGNEAATHGATVDTAGAN